MLFTFLVGSCLLLIRCCLLGIKHYSAVAYAVLQINIYASPDHNPFALSNRL